VGSRYIADRLGCTTVWVAEMARSGEVPRHCVVPGTGSGKPWKFYRERIDAWIASR
jgi:Helix-turn-helix domain